MSCTADLCGGDDWQRPGYSVGLSERRMVVVVVVVVETVVVVVVVVTVRVTAVVVLECSSGRRQRGLG